MSTKVLLALSGVLNLVLIANFVPGVNQTLDDKSGGSAKEIIEPIKIHALNDVKNIGLSDLQVEILSYGEIKYKQSLQQRHVPDKYWQADYFSSKAAFLTKGYWMIDFVTPSTLFSELYEFGNQEIKRRGYENLDFLGNLGNSIETDSSKRRFIDKNCSETLRSTSFFTIEPHIRRQGGDWGFKHENIYHFNGEGRSVEL